MTKIENLTHKTLAHYSVNSENFWEGTKDHNVDQNINALLSHIKGAPPYKILDLGCGPGRDLKRFKDLGHEPYGLDGCQEFQKMAEAYSSCKVYLQNFLDIDLPLDFFNGIFANASLFHVPKNQLSDLIKKLSSSLCSEGVLFSSNPRGSGEDFTQDRYANFMELDEYKDIIEAQGFKLLEHYYRPQGKPKNECPWLACVFRKNKI